MSFDSYFARFELQLSDFWERRQNAPIYTRTFRVFGRQIQLMSNEEQALLAVDFSLPLFTSAPAVDD